MSNIIDNLTGPIIIAKPPQASGDKVVMYAYSDAFTTCDCGKDLMLSQRGFGDTVYRGACSCGKSWALSNGKIQSWTTQKGN